MQYPRALVRKSCGKQTMLLLSSAIFFLICFWGLAIFYTKDSSNKNVIKEITIHQVSNKLGLINISEKTFHSHISLTNLKRLNKDIELLSKYGAINKKNALRYVPPTRISYRPYGASLSRYKDHLKFLDTSIFSKDSEKIMKTFDVVSGEEIILGIDAERTRHSAEMQVTF